MAPGRPLMVRSFSPLPQNDATVAYLLSTSRDILHGLVSVGRLPLPDAKLAESRKRHHSDMLAEEPKTIFSNDLSRLPHGQLSFDPVPTGMDFARWLSTDAPSREESSTSSMDASPSGHGTIDPSQLYSAASFQPTQTDAQATPDLGTGPSQQPTYEGNETYIPDAPDVWSAAPTSFE